MDGTISFARRASAELETSERVIEFYEHASRDYAYWSPNFNMHLGFFARGMNPFDRESMLERMNVEVARRLHLDRESSSLLLDLGCGMGAIGRTVARYYPNASIKSVTVSPSQVKAASLFNSDAGLADRIEVALGNYNALKLDDASADGAWAVESACYARGSDKLDLLAEMARVIKPGGRFVLADCFLKSDETTLDPFTSQCYRSLCDNWALAQMPVLDDLLSAARTSGFDDIAVEDISRRVAPSLAHTPYAVPGFLIKKWWRREPLHRQSVNNLKASLLAIFLALNRSKFGYYLITGSRIKRA